MESLLINADDVSKILKIPKSTLYTMVRDGRLQSVDFGKDIKRFNKKYIESLCEVNNSEKTWREIQLEKEIEKLNFKLDKLKGDLGAITSISTNWLR